MNEIQLSRLSLGRCIAEGSQGRIIELADHPGTVAKLYRSRELGLVDGRALAELVRIRRFVASEGLQVDDFAAWPHTVVLDGLRTAGFLMQRVHDPFLAGFGPTTALAELGLLINVGDVPMPGVYERVLLLRALAAAMDALHRQGLVLGDLSPRNIAWSTTPMPRVMLLDCDGIRPAGEPGVLPPADTRGWEDPSNLGMQPTADSDRFKLALAIARVLTGDRNAAPGHRPDLTFTGQAGLLVGPLTRLMDQAAGPPGVRPTASQWATVLDVRRPWTDPGAPMAPPAPPVPAPPAPSRGTSASGEFLRPFRFPR
ncbi:hypothetical protein FB381_2705 [Nocardioides albertanoniae]|uniref:Protein kinase domain-containing protein n=1 Tax=Nocardioides albertanoniae TaxID=1175486 RepID=A0A543A884_9ACTN|nr:hypothetical protein [Nocardioides albertanoniae]TQL68808.1 hypothetical protein FB381_2705 [Nocardioides albertanoniae]